MNYSNARSYADDGALPGPTAAKAWRYGPHAPLGKGPARTGIANEWGFVGFYENRSDAEQVLAEPERNLPFLSDTAEHWHALAAVISHRGKVDWSTKDEPHPEPKPLEADPGGVLAVVTSAGYGKIDESQFARIRNFQEKVDHVIDYFGTLDANIARSLFTATEARQGMTFSVWRSDATMATSAYRSGVHAEYIQQHKKESLFDYSSFTRLRLLDSCGSWDGIDPREAALSEAS